MCRVLKIMTTRENWCEDFGTQLVTVMSHPPICRQENFHLLLFQVILILWLSGWITATSVGDEGGRSWVWVLSDVPTPLYHSGSPSYSHPLISLSSHTQDLPPSCSTPLHHSWQPVETDVKSLGHNWCQWCPTPRFAGRKTFICCFFKACSFFDFLVESLRHLWNFLKFGNVWMTAKNGAFCARKWGWSTSLTQIFPDRHIRYILHDKHWCAGYWKSWQPDKLMCRFWDTTGDSDVPPPDLQAGKLSFVAFWRHAHSLTFSLDHCEFCEIFEKIQSYLEFGNWKRLNDSYKWSILCLEMRVRYFTDTDIPWPPYLLHFTWQVLMCRVLKIMTTRGNWCEDFGTQLVSVMSHPPICRQENFHLLLFK